MFRTALTRLGRWPVALALIGAAGLGPSRGLVDVEFQLWRHGGVEVPAAHQRGICFLPKLNIIYKLGTDATLQCRSNTEYCMGNYDGGITITIFEKFGPPNALQTGESFSGRARATELRS